MNRTLATITVIALTALGRPARSGEAGATEGAQAPAPPARAEKTFRLEPIDVRGQRPQPEDLAAIEAQAAERGQVRVILGVPIRFVPEGLLDARGARDQQREIARAQDELLSRLSGVEEVVHRYKAIPFVTVVLSPSGASGLAGIEGLASARLDREGRVSLSSSTVAMGATTAHARGFTGAGQTIAILDTGVDSSHPFLAGSVVDEACFGSCPNGGRWQIGPGSGVPLPSFIALAFHGTHVAGIAAGHRTPSISFQGVAPDARIMAINVFHRVDNTWPFNNCGSDPSPCARFFDGDVLAGLDHVFSRRGLFNIAAVNMSIGGSLFTSECGGSAYDFTVNNLLSVGIAPVAASGNDSVPNAISSPACVPGVISVGAVNNSGNIASFSNSATFLDLLAPGVGVTSSFPGGGLANMSGTSMATPHVSGSFALLKQRDPAARVHTLLQFLIQAGPKVFDTRNGVLTPRVRVDSALSRPSVFDHDFTRDRVADIAVWRPTSHEWWIFGQSSPAAVWGDVGDVAVPGDYDGNGTTDVAVFRATTHQWWIAGQPVALFGDVGDIPVPADYDGNGTTDIAVWRPSTGVWWIAGQQVTQWGAPGDIPVPADYDSDGRADLMVFRPSTGEWFNLGKPTIIHGGPGDIPVPADYDGSGSADIAIYRPSIGTWYVRNQFAFQWGAPGDIPLPRDFGDGRASVTVWRPSTGQWISWLNWPPYFQVIPWGAPTDIPL